MSLVRAGVFVFVEQSVTLVTQALGDLFFPGAFPKGFLTERVAILLPLVHLPL